MMLLGKRLKCELYRCLGQPMPASLRAFYITETLFGDRYAAASRAYQPERYDGRVVLIHTGRKDAFDPEATWENWFPGN